MALSLVDKASENIVVIYSNVNFLSLTDEICSKKVPGTGMILL